MKFEKPNIAYLNQCFTLFLGQQNGKYLSIIRQPKEAYNLLKSFLVLWKQLEVLKTDWGQKKLNVEKIDKVSLYRTFW